MLLLASVVTLWPSGTALDWVFALAPVQLLCKTQGKFLVPWLSLQFAANINWASVHGLADGQSVQTTTA